MMDGKQNVVAFGGAALIAANFWTGPQRQAITGGLFGSSGNTQAAHGQLVKLGGEILFVVVASILAGVSDRFAGLMVLTIIGLWILWALNRYSSARKGGTVQPGTTGPTGIVKGAAA